MANPTSPADFDDDDFDFGGDDGDEPGKSGGKRTFLELEDDDEDADLYPTKKMYGTSAGGNDHATTTILNLRASLEERDSTIANLKKDLTRVNGDVERWRTTFQMDSVSSVIANPEPDAVLEAVQKLLGSEARLKEQLVTAKGQVATLLVKISGKEQEILDLKSLVHDLRISLKPPMLQARRLLLDPAVHAEFTRMKKELDASEKRVKELQDDLAAVQFTPHSKNGKMLMAKCRTLQEENEEIGREASEGKMYELSTKLAMQKSLTQELKRGYHELYEYVEDLNYEAERSQQALYLLQRQVQHRDHQLQTHLIEQARQTEAREVIVKIKEEERGQQPETTRESHGGDGDSHEKSPSGDSRRR